MPENKFVLDNVRHGVGAQSPSIDGAKDKKYRYMHSFQIDNLVVFQGKRIVELYSHKHGQIERFEITAEYIKHINIDKIIFQGPVVFGRYNNIYHRVYSPEGSASMNMAEHLDGFDIKTNFNIYDLHEDQKTATVVRAGHLDQ